MYSSRNALEIALHLNDGRVVLFNQPDGGHADNILGGISAGQVFGRRVLLLRGEDSVSLFPSDKIARLDISQMVPSFSCSDDVVQADQIADYDFQWLRETLTAVQRQFPMSRRIDNFILAADLELANSEHLYLRVEFRGEGVVKRPQELFIDRLLNSGDLLVRLREGGYSIINPKSVVRLTIYPVVDSVEEITVDKAVG